MIHQNIQNNIENKPSAAVLSALVVAVSTKLDAIAFIKNVSPKIGLISAGYRSRFGHPKAEVVKRYHSMGVKLLDTVSDGAILLNFPANDNALSIQSYRKDKRGLWNR